MFTGGRHVYSLIGARDQAYFSLSLWCLPIEVNKTAAPDGFLIERTTGMSEFNMRSLG